MTFVDPLIPPLDPTAGLGTFEKCKTALQSGRNKLISMHEQKHDIEEVVKATSDLIDSVLLQLWEHHFASHSPKTLTLLAVGGYGRGELNLNSDIDLLILSKNELDQTTEAEIRTFIQILWDLNMEVGHSVRSLDQCITVATADVTIMTNLLEARSLLTDMHLNQHLQKAIRKQSIWPNQTFFKAKVEEQAARHEALDDTAYKLEPNIKSSPGGLRDLQTISWMANRIFGVLSLEDASATSFVEQGEKESLIRNRNLLWRIRNCLHVASKRSENRILFNYQPEIASYFGLTDSDDQLAIEQLMQQYYRAAKEIRRLNEFILQQIEHSFITEPEQILPCSDERFYIVNNHLTHKKADIFKQDPSAILGIFVVYQRDANIKNFSTSTVRAIRAHLHLIDEAFRNDAKNLHTFLSIFTYDLALTRTIRKLDTYGVLGRFLPVYGRIAGQMQHDLFHAYTVDAHSLFVVRNLRRFAQTQFDHEFPELSDIMCKTRQRHRVYLAGLFHDIAKGRGGNHDTEGAIEARKYCTLLRMPPDDVELVAWLVQNHLQMSKVSQREDLSDTEVIDKFAALVGNQNYLDNLYLLTVADIRATSPATWTAWKGHLLSQLYNKTTRAFGNAEQEREVDDRAKSKRRKNDTAQLLKNSVNVRTLNQYWAMLDEEYVLSHRPATMAWHAQKICSASALDMPVVDTRYLTEYEAQQYLIYTADSPYVLPAVTRAFDELGQSILQARIHTANPGFTILLFTVTNMAAEQAPEDAELKQNADAVRDALIETRSQPSAKKRLLPRVLKEFDFKPEINVSQVSEQGNISLTIVALDEPGLINKISKVFAQCQVRLISASITTVGEKAEDIFTVGHPSKAKPLTDDHAAQLNAALTTLLSNRAASP